MKTEVAIYLMAIVTVVSGQDSPTYFSIKQVNDSAFFVPVVEAFDVNKGQVTHRVDLNGDGMEDLIVSFGNCGNWGDCIFGFFVAAPDKKYQCVFVEYLSPFSISKQATSVDGMNWKDILVSERGIDPEGNPKVVEKRMYFDGETYTLN